MEGNYVQYSSPQFRILSDQQLEKLHHATLEILERTGVTVDCEEAIELLDGAGADVSDPQRVKIPSHLIERALRTVRDPRARTTRRTRMGMAGLASRSCSG